MCIRDSVEDAPYDFSFSGLKSAVLNYINGCQMKGIEYNQADIAASFQKAVTDVLVANACLLYTSKSSISCSVHAHASWG